MSDDKYEAMRKKADLWITAHTELCAAIARMPIEVECCRHRKHRVVIDTDTSHRQPLIDLYYKQRRWIKSALED